jgi:hypothetical protein
MIFADRPGDLNALLAQAAAVVSGAQKANAIPPSKIVLSSDK